MKYYGSYLSESNFLITLPALQPVNMANELNKSDIRYSFPLFDILFYNGNPVYIIFKTWPGF